MKDNLAVGDVVRVIRGLEPPWNRPRRFITGPICFIQPGSGRFMILGCGIMYLPNDVEYLFMRVKKPKILEGSCNNIKNAKAKFENS